MTTPTKEEIRKKRKAVKLSQVKAAELIGVGRRTWQDWEAGTYNMRPGLWELFQIKAQSRKV